MKKLMTIMSAAIALSSCTKTSDLLPLEQVVTYKLSCDNCLIYLEDDRWNSGNKQPQARHQYFNVSGEFEYSFTNPVDGLDTASAVVSVSVLYPIQQEVLITISDNQGRSVKATDLLGFNSDWTAKSEYEVTIKLPLK